MRAIYLPELESSDEIIIQGPKFHHLITVSRAKVGDLVLLMNGKGYQAHSLISEIGKRYATLKLSKIKKQSRAFDLTLALCIPKKDALDLCLKQAVEIGVNHIYLVESDFSVNKHIKEDRINRLIESAMEQANNPFRLSFQKIGSINGIPFKQFDKCYCLTSQEEYPFKNHEVKGEKQLLKQLLLIGPEGGFSQNENTLLGTIANLQKVKLATHILRTPTAVSLGCGLVISLDM